MDELLNGANYSEDHISLKPGIILSYRRSPSRIVELQRGYGPRNVIYCPPPFLSCKEVFPVKNQGTGEKFLLIIGGNKSDSQIEMSLRLIKHVSDKYSNTFRYNATAVVDKKTSIDLFKTILETNPKFVFVICSNSWIATTVLSTGIPFCLFNPSFDSYQHFLDEIDFGRNVIRTQDYNVLKNSFRDVHSNLDETRNKLETTLAKLRDDISMCSLLFTNGQLKKNITEDVSEQDSAISLPFWFDDRLHSDSPELAEIAASMRRYGKFSGIYFDIAVVRTYLFKETQHLYPWAGIVEVSDTNDICALFECQNFILNLSFCQGLFVMTNTIQEVLTKNLQSAGYKLEVRLIPLFEIPADVPFDLEAWELQPRMYTIMKDKLSSIALKSIKEPVEDRKLVENDKAEAVLEHASSEIFVVMNKSEPLVGCLISFLSRRTPVIISKDSALDKLLPGYPLSMERLTPAALQTSITVELVRQAVMYLENYKIINLQQLMRKLSVSKTYMKCKIISETASGSK